MEISLLNLISTPVASLNSLGLDLKVGLSSEDPMVRGKPSEPYEAYLTVYSPEGVFLVREHLGRIPPERRRLFDISSITRRLVPDLDHLSVVHRIPTRLLDQAGGVEGKIVFDEEPDYGYFRSLVQYSYPGGGNGSVIYETPPGLNSGRPTNTLTFTCQIVLSEQLNTHLLLINSSMDPAYSRIANYNFAIHSSSGEQVASSHVTVGPFGIKVLDMAQIIPPEAVESEKDPQDGISAFTTVGYCDDAALMSVVLNTSPALGAVALEHTHPPQTYLFPYQANQQRAIKSAAVAGWESRLSARRGS